MSVRGFESHSWQNIFDIEYIFAIKGNTMGLMKSGFNNSCHGFASFLREVSEANQSPSECTLKVKNGHSQNWIRTGLSLSASSFCESSLFYVCLGDRLSFIFILSSSSSSLQIKTQFITFALLLLPRRQSKLERKRDRKKSLKKIYFRIKTFGEQLIICPLASSLNLAD